MTRSMAALATAMIILVSNAAWAQDYVRPDCRAFISAVEAPRTHSQDRWYRRFWTGNCADLVLCVSGSPNWNQIVDELIARAAANQQTAVKAKACELGQLIGLEWSREKRVRRINTADLRGFKAKLDAAPNVLEGLRQIDASARAKLGRP